MSNPTISIKGRDKILKHFGDQKFPLWRLFVANDTRSVLGVNFDVQDFRKSLSILQDLVDNIQPDVIYTLETYKVQQDKKYTKADTSVNFILGELPEVSGIGKQENNYAPSSLKDQFTLVRENAKFEAEISFLKFQVEELQKKNIELNSKIVDLQIELADYEDDDEDDDEVMSGMSGNAFMDALATLVKEKGGSIVDHVTKGGKKLEDEEIKMSGMNDSDVWKKYTIQQYVDLLAKEDPHLQYHLYRLVLIAQKKPDSFKMLLNMLENY